LIEHRIRGCLQAASSSGRILPAGSPSQASQSALTTDQAVTNH
jgi:hypothetical protein